MSYMSANNMPPVVSPMSNAAPAMMPNMMPHVNVFEQKTENTYLMPYAKPHHPVYSDTALILVLFILLVIISRGIGAFGKI